MNPNPESGSPQEVVKTPRPENAPKEPVISRFEKAKQHATAAAGEIGNAFNALLGKAGDVSLAPEQQEMGQLSEQLRGLNQQTLDSLEGEKKINIFDALKTPGGNEYFAIAYQSLQKADLSDSTKTRVDNGVREYIEWFGGSVNGKILNKEWIHETRDMNPNITQDEAKKVRAISATVANSANLLAEGKADYFNTHIADKLIERFRERVQEARSSGDEELAKVFEQDVERYRDLKGILLKETADKIGNKTATPTTEKPPQVTPANQPPKIESSSPRQPEVIGRNEFMTAQSIASDEHSYRNEDSMMYLRKEKAFGIFDGMGGLAKGKEASTRARGYVSNAFQNLPKGLSLPEAQEYMKKVLIDANKVVHDYGQSIHKTVGTTASIGYIWEGPSGERKAIVANVGDSRIYLMRNGRLEQITIDDNGVRASAKDDQEARKIQTKMNNVTNPSKELTDVEQKQFEKLYEVTQGVGISVIKPSIYTVDMLPTDKLIACSDGISDNLTDREMNEILQRNPNNAQAIQQLIASSNSRSRDSQHPRAKPDDMSAIIVDAGALSSKY